MGSANFFTLYTIIFLGIFSPGPGILIIIRAILFTNFQKALALALGVISVDMTYVAIVSIFADFIQYFKYGIFLITLFGTIYLGKMSIEIFLSIINNKVKKNNRLLKRKNEEFSYVRGYLFNSSNPKTILFYISIIAPMIGTITTIDMVLITFLAGVSVIVVYMSITYFFKAKFLTPTFIKGINIVSAIIFGVLSVYMLFEAYNIYTDISLENIDTSK